MDTRDPGLLMWSHACEVLERAERLHRHFFQPVRHCRQPTWQPPVDMFETAAEIRILIALPGVDPEHVEVTAEDGVIVIAGTRPIPHDAREAAIHRLEIPHGRFERRIALPPGRYQLGRRELTNGCLCLSLEK